MSDKSKNVYVLTVDLPNLPKGELIQIPGLGTFKNGDSFDINEEAAENYRVYHGRQEPIYDQETSSILGTEWAPGPTLLQASEHMYGVSVKTTSSGGQQSNSGGSNPSSNQNSSGDDKDNEKQGVK